MLDFTSSSVRIANSRRAVDECIEIAYGERENKDCKIAIVNAAMGHKLENVAGAIKEHFPDSIVLGTSCGGVIGCEGVGEAMTNLAMMMIGGAEEEYSVACVDDIHGNNSYEKALELANNLKKPCISIIYLICPGLDIMSDMVVKAFNDVYGNDVVIFGGTSADNYKAITTYQFINGTVTEHGAWAIGFADNTLKFAAKATHGFTAYGEPMTVTEGYENKIVEIDGIPAWSAYFNRLNLIPKGDPTLAIIASGALAERLPDDVAEEYGNSHILRSAIQEKQEGVMYMSISVKEGDQFWLTARDEDLIFSEQKKALDYLCDKLEGHKPVAVFQADCLARGRTLFNKVMKDELVGMMHDMLSKDGEIPPWLGMYGFGEFCPLGGENVFHTYTTSLLVIYR